MALTVSVIVCARNEASCISACLHSVLDLFSLTSLKYYPYVADSDVHEPKHPYSWTTLVRAAKNWPSVRNALRGNVDVALTLYRERS